MPYEIVGGANVQNLKIFDRTLNILVNKEAVNKFFQKNDKNPLQDKNFCL